ncbi:hypothetical protein C8Q70DRAFT_1047971 [Cubamyces menziesii]|nr:hypothetical protein C8Q70DRAFT_1047971 [Cubamyces menziesii]
MDRRENPPPLDVCPECKATLVEADEDAHLATVYRCLDCHLPAPVCKACILKFHTHRPFDRLRMWHRKEQFWHNRTVADLGYVWVLGHGGTRCPSHTAAVKTMTVIHEHGIMDLPTVFCACEEAPPHTEQLIQAGLWPATWKRPATATTLGALETFHALEMQAQLNVHDYMNYIRQSTDDVLPHKVQDRYREFNNSMRVYRHIVARRRHGQSAGDVLKPGSLAMICPACPQPGINMRPGWEKRSAEYNYVDALHYSIDGNFHLGLKNKDTDPNDAALSEGAAYFVNTKDFKYFLEHAPKPKKESTTCHQFGAMGYGKYKGPVSGVVAITCRHSFMLPGSIVDLTRAEQYRYVDFALVSAMQRYIKLHLLVGCYDIHCQYIKNLRTRLRDEFGVTLENLESIDVAILPKIVALVGKYHLAMHKGECRHKHSLHFVPGSCMSDGEHLERVWAITNAVARRTKEMSAGHRHDLLNDHYSYINFRRLQTLVDDLVKFLETAEKRLKAATDYITEIEVSINTHHPTELDDWRQEEREWQSKVVDITQHKGLANPYEPAPTTALTTKAIAEHLEAERNQTATAGEIGSVGTVEQVIRLREDAHELRTKVVKFKGGEKARSRMADDVERYRRQAEACRKNYEACIQPAIDMALHDINTDEVGDRFPARDDEDDKSMGVPTAPPDSSGNRATPATSASQAERIEEWLKIIDDQPFLLPSDLHSCLRTHVALTEIRQVERKLREGQANEALDSLRLHLTTHLSLAFRKQQGSGVIHNSAADRRLEAKRVAIDEAKAAYRAARVTLIVLGMSPEDDKYRELKDADCVAFKVVSEEARRGDSYRNQSWIWGDFSFAGRLETGDVQKFVLESMKVHWFRQHALKTRWEEEVNVRREEMYRTVKYLEHEVDLWKGRATVAEADGMRGAAATARR